ncbi:MAG: ABC transporter ATP-binding protein, partial [Lachnospiraceae bacterium]|nr:ABC transporter ATP-binding protein [Lachnospiraceae bacterium]
FSAMDPASRMDAEKVLLGSADMVIAISHDRSPENLGRYDEVIYMDEGQVVAKGAYDELKRNGIAV